MRYADLTPWECEMGFGRPSGHSYGSIFFFPVIMEYFLRKAKPPGAIDQAIIQHDPGLDEQNLDEIVLIQI